MVLLTATSAVAEWVPFVIPMVTTNVSRIAFESSPILTNSPRLEARDGHFRVDGKRVRIWGVNLCFAATVPSHQEAERVAARMAQAGINGVRLHHMDTSAYPSGLLDPANPLRLQPEACERLDYFIAQLANRGIYVNLNLHVGRAVSRQLGLPDPGTGYDKIVGLFMPPLLAAQRQYAQDLLGHTNAYRRLRYADDPAVGFVEISNEDSLFMWGAEQRLRDLPAPYAAELRALHAKWLRTQYGNTEGVRAAWDRGVEPPGPNLLAPDRLADGAIDGVPGWRLEQHAPCVAQVTQPPGTTGVVRVEISHQDGVAWHVQAKQSPFSLEGGRHYTLSFRARAGGARSLGFSVMQDRAPWGGLGLQANVGLSTNWQSFRTGFVAASSCSVARLSFALAGHDAWVEVAEARLSLGGQQGLMAGESVEKATVALFGEGESEPRSLDRMRFLAMTERAYFDGMRRFLREDLGVKALVTGTMVFGPCGLYGQGGMDYVDSHAYWQHPHFPGRPWDSTNWIVEQRAMVDSPGEATLPRLSTARVAGKPFTLSEYNHCAPNDFQAECVPMVAAWAAAQDWDAVWLFAWSHRSDDPARARFESFFDIDANPAKLGFMRAGAALFREGALPALVAEHTVPLTSAGSPPLESLARLHWRGRRPWGGPDLTAAFESNGKLDWERMLAERIGVSWETTAAGGSAPSSSLTRLEWRAGDGSKGGVFVAAGSGARVLVRHRGVGEVTEAAGMRVVAPAFAVITETTLDGLPFETSRRILITACGRAENTAMGFSADRRTVGRDWGQAPARIEPVSGTIALPPGQWRGWALGPDGVARSEALIGIVNGRLVMQIGGPAASMWYLAERPDQVR
jgi:hypothetical protein